MKKFILNNIPDYSVKIDSAKKLEEFRDNKEDYQVNKVILFSKKKSTPPIYKALTAYYKDKLRFAFVQNETKEVVSQYSDLLGEKMPAVVVL